MEQQPLIETVQSAPPEMVASVGVDTAISQVRTLVPADSGAGPGLMVAAALLFAVVGAAIKFAPQLLKDRSANAERRHEMELERMRQNEEQHKKCEAGRTLLESRLASLEGRLAEISDKPEPSIPLADFDTDALEKRLKKIESKLRAKDKSK